MSAAPTAVLLDLDGTLVDSRPGIVAGVNTILREHGLPEQSAAELTPAIGPPLHDTFARLLGRPREDLEPVVTAYRAHYARLMLTGSLPYPGVGELLEELRAAGHPLAVATSKAQHLAVALLEHLGLAGHFTAIRGPLPPAREAKAGTVARALDALGLAPGARAVLVGDRHHDVEGGRANGLRVLGVTWGYGAREELEAAGADALADTPGEVPGLLAALTAPPPPAAPGRAPSPR